VQDENRKESPSDAGYIASLVEDDQHGDPVSQLSARERSTIKCLLRFKKCLYWLKKSLFSLIVSFVSKFIFFLVDEDLVHRILEVLSHM
jgi:hypothetical protein